MSGFSSINVRMLWLLLFNGWTSCLAMPALSLKNITQENFSRGSSSLYPLCCVCKMFQVLSLSSSLFLSHFSSQVLRQSQTHSHKPTFAPSSYISFKPVASNYHILVFWLGKRISNQKLKMIWSSVGFNSTDLKGDRWIKKRDLFGFAYLQFLSQNAAIKNNFTRNDQKIEFSRNILILFWIFWIKAWISFAKIDWLLRKSIRCDMVSFPGHFLAV